MSSKSVKSFVTHTAAGAAGVAVGSLVVASVTITRGSLLNLAWHIAPRLTRRVMYTLEAWDASGLEAQMESNRAYHWVP